MREFIDRISKGLASDDFCERNGANTALLAYDMGRARNEEERDNARQEWEFRLYAFESNSGLSGAMKMIRRR